jgi:hypothetical protein
MMAFFVFVGLFVAATANAVLGTMIALTALVFLFFTLFDPASVCSRRLAHRRASKAPGREDGGLPGPGAGVGHRHRRRDQRRAGRWFSLIRP